jgi:hypothetical protein
MTAVGVGVGVGFGGVGLSPSWLATGLAQDIGATPTALWLGEDLGAVGSAVETWPHRVGAPLVNYLETGNRGVVVAVNGRKGVNMAATVGNMLLLDGATVHKTVLVVTSGSAAVNSNEVWAISSYDGTGYLMRNGTTGAFYGGGWTHYVNGTANENVPASGVAVFGATYTSNSKTGLGIGGIPGATRPAPTPILAVLTWTSAASAGQVAAASARLARYYRI